MRGKIILREETIRMFQDHKWIILIRDNETQDWRIFRHQYSDRPMRYSTLKAGLNALKTTQKFRYRYGHAKLAKLEGRYLANQIQE